MCNINLQIDQDYLIVKADINCYSVPDITFMHLNNNLLCEIEIIKTMINYNVYRLAN